MMEDTIRILRITIDHNTGVENLSLENKRVRIEKEIIKSQQLRVRRRKKIRTNNKRKLNKVLEIMEFQISQ
jgi:hypothetical protein